MASFFCPAGIISYLCAVTIFMIMQKSNWFAAPAIVLAVLSSAGCGGRPKPGAAAPTAQSAPTAPTAPMAQPTQSAQTETPGSVVPADSCKPPVRYNEACLSLFELTGPVEDCVVENWQTGTAEGEYEMPDLMWGRDYGFNRRGYLVFDGCSEYTYRADTLFLYGEDARAGMSASLTYDAAGRIVAQKLEYVGDAVGDGEQSTEYSYDDAGRPVRAYALLWEAAVETLYTYDTAGRLVTRRETTRDYDGSTERIHTYEYVKFDGRGNWTQRKVTVKSTVVQPVEGAEHERSEVVHEPDVYQFESRRIIYYEE